MIEKVLFDYLNSKLDVPVYLERPANPPEKFVVIERTGGKQEDLINRATIAVQSIARTLYETVGLSDMVIMAMNDAICLPEIGSVYLNSVYNFTNKNQTDRDEHRYQSVWEITYY